MKKRRAATVPAAPGACKSARTWRSTTFSHTCTACSLQQPPLLWGDDTYGVMSTAPPARRKAVTFWNRMVFMSKTKRGGLERGCNVEGPGVGEYEVEPKTLRATAQAYSACAKLSSKLRVWLLERLNLNSFFI